MERSQLLRTLLVIGPILGMLGLGFCIALRSGVSRIDTSVGIRLAMGNLSRLLVLVAGCLIGMAVLQQFIGYRVEMPW